MLLSDRSCSVDPIRLRTYGRPFPGTPVSVRRNRLRRAGWTLALLLSLTLPIGAQSAGLDLHWFWDQRCGDCHGHAGEFARAHLSIREARLVGRHHTDDLKLFLANHGVPANEVDAVYAMLSAQAGATPAFQSRCGRCHDNAAAFARDALVLKDGVLFGRHVDRPVAEFLPGHAGVTAAQAPEYVELLLRVEQEVHRP
jgi:bacterioferritin-associated ferredoxin